MRELNRLLQKYLARGSGEGQSGRGSQCLRRQGDRIASTALAFANSRQTAWWATCLLLAVLTAPVTARASEPKIVVSPQIRAEVATELDFRVQVDSTNPLPAGCSIIITGLPKSVTFSAGSAIGSTGVWEVPLLALDRLKMVVPDSEASSSILIIFLAIKKKDLAILASARSFLVIEAPTEDARRQVKQAEEERLAEAKKAEAARAAELAKAAEDARRQAAARKAEEERLAEAKKAEAARAAELAKAAEDARRQAAARKAEEERLAEVKKAEEARSAEAVKAAEDARRQAAAKKAEEERLAEAKKAEEARAAELAKAAEDARRQAAAKKAEEERLAEAKKAEAARAAELAEAAEDARRQAAARKAEEERLAEAKKAEAARSAELAKAAEDARRQAATRKAEEERLAEAKRAEARAAELAKAAEIARLEVAAKRAEDERLAEAKRARLELVYANGRGSVRGAGSCRKSARHAGFRATRKAGRARGPLPRPRQHSGCPAVLPSRRPGWACRCRFQTRRNTRPPRACAPEGPRVDTRSGRGQKVVHASVGPWGLRGESSTRAIGRLRKRSFGLCEPH